MVGDRTTPENERERSRFVAVADLVFVAGCALVAGVAIITGVLGGTARVLVAAPLLGFFPGYVVVATLFPARATTTTDTPASRWVRGPNWTKRFSLSVAASLVVLVLAALPLSALGAAFDVTTLTGVVVGVTLAGAVAATFARRSLAAADRFVVPVDKLVAGARARTVDASLLDAGLNVALAVPVVVAASTVAGGLAAPDRGEADTEVALLSEQGDELVANNDTTSFQRGAASNVTLTVENREGASMEYTAVVVLERVRTGGDSAVLERTELDRETLAAADRETVRERLSVQPTILGDNLRLNVFVYEGDAPATATADTASHHLYLWVDVNQSDGAA